MDERQHKTKSFFEAISHRKKVGNPDNGKDFSARQVGTESYVQNSTAADLWCRNNRMVKPGKPVDRDEWDADAAVFFASSLATAVWWALNGLASFIVRTGR